MHLKIKFKAKKKKKKKESYLLPIQILGNTRLLSKKEKEKKIMITIKDDIEEFAWDPNQIKTKYMKPNSKGNS